LPTFEVRGRIAEGTRLNGSRTRRKEEQPDELKYSIQDPTSRHTKETCYPSIQFSSRPLVEQGGCHVRFASVPVTKQARDEQDP